MKARAATGLLLLATGACRSQPEPVPASGNTPKSERQEGASASAKAAAPDTRAAERKALFDEVAREAEIADERVLGALLRVERHRFVPDDVRDAAYEDRPLPIGHRQTISQPTVVAVMTAAVAPAPTDRCLEIGTGSGYQAAVLAELCQKVYSIEYLEPLARFAERNLRGAGYGPGKVELRTGDGYRGWPDAAPFQVIVVTAAPPKVPQPLFDQLALGGRLIVPVGPEHGVQSLELYRRKGPGSDPKAVERQVLMSVRFVPFVGEAQK